MSDVYVKFLRAHEGWQRGEVVALPERAAQSLCRKGIACPAPADLWPPAREYAVVEDVRAERRG